LGALGGTSRRGTAVRRLEVAEMAEAAEHEGGQLTLTQARDLRDAAYEKLAELGQRVYETLHGTDRPMPEIASITVHSGQPRGSGDTGTDEPESCVVWHDMHGGCVEYCDPPGVCRDCGSGPVAATVEPVRLLG
jgi:hypothetical protein